MGERTDQIEEEIRVERQELGRNLDQLERQVKRATDWREQLGDHPMAAMSMAFGGGFLLSMLFSGRNT